MPEMSPTTTTEAAEPTPAEGAVGPVAFTPDSHAVFMKVNAVGRGTLEVDGRDISPMVSAVSFDASAGDLSVMALQLNLRGGAVLRTEAAVAIAKETADFLESLGWTPPEKG